MESVKSIQSETTVRTTMSGAEFCSKLLYMVDYKSDFESRTELDVSVTITDLDGNRIMLYPGDFREIEVELISTKNQDQLSAKTNQ